jgi:hypothetical protein
MKTAELLQVLRGEAARISETHATPALARQARARAYALLHQTRTRYALEATAKIYVDPEDPCVIVCDTEGATAASKYAPVLHLREGDECVLDLGDTLLQSVKARLKTLAAETAAALGSRPCWVASPVHGQEGLYKVVRLPDDYNPGTGRPRGQFALQQQQCRAADSRRDWARFNKIQDLYERQVVDAFDEGLPPPPLPEELRHLAARLLPGEVTYLENLANGRTEVPAV